MRRIPHDAEHLVRLALLFAAGVGVFLIVRAVLVPDGFGELGHFRTGAIQESRDKTLHFAGRAACTACHTDSGAALAASKHGAIGCESCHDALAAHAADPKTVKPRKLDVVALCSGCHARNPARPLAHPQVDVAPHAEGARCTECHDAHAPGQ